MEEVAVFYFSNLLKAQPREELDSLFPHLELPQLTPDMLEVLAKTFIALEVSQALKEMHPSKAPGPDGFHAAFYQKFWYLIGEEVKGIVLDTLNNGKDLSMVNTTNIALIPKLKDAKRI